MHDSIRDVKVPSDPYEAARVRETRRRRRLLEGTWDEDLEHRLVMQFGPQGRAIKGPRTKAKNLFRSVPEQLAVLYNEVPHATHAELDEDNPLLGPGGFVREAGLWQLMRHVQTYTLGCRETLVRVGWSARAERLTFTHVTADQVIAEAPPDDPGRPWMIQQLRFYDVPDMGGRWCWEAFDIRDLEEPRYQIFVWGTGKHDRGEDVTARLVDDAADYPWRYADDRPFLPFALYHAERPSGLWDPHKWCELVDGALDLAVAATHFQHLLLRGSYSLKYALNAFVAGTRSKETAAGQRSAIPTDPTSLLHLEGDAPPGQQASIGEWGPPTSLVEYIEALQAYERMISNVAGVDASHILKESSDAWSGAALTISRDGKREAQRVYGPQFQVVDEELLGKAAAICNVQTGSDLPEDGYRVQHKSLPLSGKELRELREHHSQMIAEGRMSTIDALQAEHPGMTRTEAVLMLQRIAEDQLLVRRLEAATQPGDDSPGNPAPPEPDEDDDDVDEERAA